VVDIVGRIAPAELAKEAYSYGKRGLFTRQKRPIQKRPIHMAKEAYSYENIYALYVCIYALYVCLICTPAAAPAAPCRAPAAAASLPPHSSTAPPTQNTFYSERTHSIVREHIL
jgi:hypothetical protein